MTAEGDPRGPADDEAVRSSVAAALFDAGASGKVEMDGGCVNALIRFDGLAPFTLVAIPYGPRGPVAERTFFGQLLAWEGPLHAFGRDLPEWRQVKGWNAQRAREAPNWRGTARELAREAVVAGRRWRAQGGPAATLPKVS